MEFFRLYKENRVLAKYVWAKITNKIISLFLLVIVKDIVDSFMFNALNNGLTVKLKNKFMEQ